MALRQYKNGAYLEVGGLNHRVDGETTLISALYQFVAGRFVPVWDGALSNFVTGDGKVIVTSDSKLFNATI